MIVMTSYLTDADLVSVKVSSDDQITESHFPFHHRQLFLEFLATSLEKQKTNDVNLILFMVIIMMLIIIIIIIITIIRK